MKMHELLNEESKLCRDALARTANGTTVRSNDPEAVCWRGHPHRCHPRSQPLPRQDPQKISHLGLGRKQNRPAHSPIPPLQYQIPMGLPEGETPKEIPGVEDSDVECPRCYRISFAWDNPRSTCPECHWVIRPTPVEKPYGYDVLVELNTPDGGTTTIEKHYKGKESNARNQAKRVPRFSRVLAVVPIAEANWLAAYGEGRM